MRNTVHFAAVTITVVPNAPLYKKSILIYVDNSSKTYIGSAQTSFNIIIRDVGDDIYIYFIYI